MNFLIALYAGQVFLLPHIIIPVLLRNLRDIRFLYAVSILAVHGLYHFIIHQKFHGQPAEFLRHPVLHPKGLITQSFCLAFISDVVHGACSFIHIDIALYGSFPVHIPSYGSDPFSFPVPERNHGIILNNIRSPSGDSPI